MKELIKTHCLINSNGCWEWQRSRHRQGYGSIRDKGKYILAHRLSWMVIKGNIPSGLNVCHACDNPPCCNPEHLFLGSQKDNVTDAIVKGRYKGRKLGKRRSVLTYSQVQEIRKLHIEGMERKEIREKFNVSQTCIAKILTGKSWQKNWEEEL